MKAMLMFLVLLSTLSFGQNLPVVVDNSKWFPPAGVQYWNSCGVYSFTYLKGYYWNRYYNRDPKLPENQFEPYFIWNLNISPISHSMGFYSDFYAMKQQGVGSVKDFNFSGESQEIMPSLKARENALSFKSKSYEEKYLGEQGELEIQEYIHSLKDSLNRGICFSLHFPLFKSIEKLYEPNKSVYSYENNPEADMYASHFAAVVGYNDTIETKTGRGAFKILNSWGKVFGEDGYFYLDYKWFNMPRFGFACYFLEEDFDHQAELYLALNLTQSISGEDIANRKYIFVDALKNMQGKNIDFSDWDSYCAGRNIVNVKSINKKNINTSNEIIFLNNHDHIGSHDIISDLTDYVKSSDFQSLELVINDPVSAVYVAQDDKVFYSYSREASSKVLNPLIKFIGTDKVIIGKVVDLPDTTIVVKDFYSRVAGIYLTSRVWEEIYVKSCTSVLKRKLITFSIEDVQGLNTAPVFLKKPISITGYANKACKYQLEANDKESDPLTFSIVDPLEGVQVSSNGEINYNLPFGDYEFSVIVSDGKDSSVAAVTAKIDITDAAPEIEESDYAIKVYPNPIRSNSTIEIFMKKSATANIAIFDLQGRQIDTVIAECVAGSNNVEYDASNLRSGTYICKVATAHFKKTIKIVKQ